jgi:antiviral helicase SKI2
MQDGIRMAGVLVHDGVGRGSPPMLEIISPGAVRSTRRSEDLLPYIPYFRTYFSPLPRSLAEMTLQLMKVSLADVECITKTTVKVSSQPIYPIIGQTTNWIFRST